MSTIDASIPLGIRPVQVESPLNMLAQMMQVKSAQNQNDLAQYGIAKAQRDDARTNRLDQLMTGGNATPQSLRNAGFLKESLDWEERQAKMGREQAAGEKDSVETEHKAISIYRDASQAIADPQSAVAFVTTMHADPRLKNSAIARVPLDQLLAKIPQDPAQLAAWKQEFALGATKFMEMNKPQYITSNTGGQTVTTGVAGLTGQTTPVQSLTNTQSPDNAATNARSAADAAASRAQSERHFQAGQNAPQYMETDAGLVALPRKLAPGQQPTGTPVMGANGQPLGKPLKDIPPAVNTAIIQNNQSLNQIDRALTLLEGKDVGTQKGDKAATGAKGYLPQGILNRVDPKGVDARAEVSDIGSLKIHDRSGAAVTISESPRLMPFVPLATDDAVTVKKKLQRLKLEIKNEREAMDSTYSREQGYKPSPVQPKGTGVTVTNW